MYIYITIRVFLFLTGSPKSITFPSGREKERGKEGKGNHTPLNTIIHIYPIEKS